MSIKLDRALKRLVRPVVASMIASIVPLCSSLAVPGLSNRSPDSTRGPSYQAQEPTGTLISTGQITLNGNEVPSGATVFTNSTVATGASSSAVVDLGPIGRIELGPDTTVLIRFSNDSLSVSASCGTVRIRVLEGSVQAVSAKGPRPLASGEEDLLRDRPEIIAKKGSSLALDCNGPKVPFAAAGGGGGAPISGSMIGLITTVSAAGAVAAGFAIAGGDAPSRISPSVP